MKAKPRKSKFEVTADGSIIGRNGKVLFFSLERFKRDIVEGDCCFICGCSRESRKFNDEHVIRELMARISYEAILVSTRPKFLTEIRNGFPAISAKIPRFVKTRKGDNKEFGMFLHHLCSKSLNGYEIENKEFILENLKRGKCGPSCSI